MTARPAGMTDVVDRATRALTDAGLIIEAGFEGFRRAALPDDMSSAQLAAMRQTFFAGAQHLFASILTLLDPGEEPTDDDLRRMDAIQAELQQFIDDFQTRHLPTKGSACPPSCPACSRPTWRIRPARNARRRSGASRRR